MEKKEQTKAEDLRQQMVEVITGKVTKGPWATAFVNSRGWSIFDTKYPKLKALKKTLPLGLADVLKKHERLLHNPFFTMEAEESMRLTDHLEQISDRLVWINEVLFGDAKKTQKPGGKAKIRYERLALDARGKTVKGESEPLPEDNVLNELGRYQWLLLLTLSEQVKSAHHPFLSVLKWHKSNALWATRAGDAHTTLLEKRKEWKANGTAMQVAFLLDLWNLWKDHLTGTKTDNGRGVAERPTSPLFQEIVRDLIEPFIKWRKRRVKLFPPDVISELKAHAHTAAERP